MNNKYVRFQFEENGRRGKTPNHSETKGQTQFKFDNVQLTISLNFVVKYNLVCF